MFDSRKQFFIPSIHLDADFAASPTLPPGVVRGRTTRPPS